MDKQEITVKAGQFNILMTFAVRYALGSEVHAPDTVHNMIRENLEKLNEQTKQGIIRDIRDYIEPHGTVPNISAWKDVVRKIQYEGRMG